MDPRIIGVLILCIIIIGFLLKEIPNRKYEKITDAEELDEQYGYVRLYEDYRGEKLSYELDASTSVGVPVDNELEQNADIPVVDQYNKLMIKTALRRADVYVPKKGDDYDAIRRVEIWSVFGGAPTASNMAGFFNTYLEPENKLMSNPGKFKKILTVYPGQRVQQDFTDKIDQILLIARL